MKDSFLFLNANTPWVYALAENLAHYHPTHAVRLYDWRTYWKGGRPAWPDSDPDADITQTMRVMPTGYAGRLEPLARPFMRWMITRWQEELTQRAGAEPWVIAPYPYLTPWVEAVPDNRLIYYNLDAYALYRPERAEAIRENERRLVERAALTLCLSQHQVETLRDRYPDHTNRIVHFPLGVAEDFINPQPERKPESDTVGYVGNMTDRVDWLLVHAVAQRLSDLEFIFVGGLEKLETGGTAEGWEQARSRVLSLPNVEHVGRVPQEKVKDYYWSFAVNWIPYDAEHPFNRAACPTKIMDAIASGRPVVSTPVPECTLYPEWITIADTPQDLGSTIRQLQSCTSTEGAKCQVAYAHSQTWEQRAERFLELTVSREA